MRNNALIRAATAAVFLSLILTFLAIFLEWGNREDFLELTEILLSWEVITGGIVIGAGTTYKKELRDLLGRLG
jgi:hypothetical protein